MKKLLLAGLVLAAQPALAASSTDAILNDLASTFTDTFAEQGFMANASKWNQAVAGVQSLVDKNKDKDLIKGYEGLKAQNKVLMNAYEIMMREGQNIGKFEQVAKEAGKERDALKKVVFVLPGKRDTREVLVKLGDHLVNAALIGNARAQIGLSLATLRTVSDLRSVVDDMETLRKSAETQSKAIEKEVRDSVDPDVKALEVAKAYVEKRKKTRDELKAKQALKIEEITALDAELIQLTESISTVYDSLSRLPQEFAMTVFMAAHLGGLSDAETKAAKLNKKLEKAKRTIMNISLAMDKVDNLIENKASDPHFERDRDQAMEAAKKARADVEETRKKIASLTKEALAGHNKQADDMIKKYEAKAKVLPCKDARTIGGGKRALEACEKMANDILQRFGPDAKLADQCRIGSAALFTTCATAVGKKF